MNNNYNYTLMSFLILYIYIYIVFFLFLYSNDNKSFIPCIFLFLTILLNNNFNLFELVWFFKKVKHYF